jgi:hypothetical protein
VSTAATTATYPPRMRPLTHSLLCVRLTNLAIIYLTSATPVMCHFDLACRRSPRPCFPYRIIIPLPTDLPPI